MVLSDQKNLKLLLCRHADARFPEKGQHDFFRSLSEVGIIELEQGKKWLLQHITEPPKIFCSAAERTTRTATILASVFTGLAAVREKELYNCSAKGLLRFVNNYAGTDRFLMLVAHNPGISQFASDLSGNYMGFATSQMVLLELFADSWPEVSFGAAEVKKVFVPAEI